MFLVFTTSALKNRKTNEGRGMRKKKIKKIKSEPLAFQNEKKNSKDTSFNKLFPMTK